MVRISHVYKPFVTVRYTDGDTEEERRYLVLRFGLDARDAADSTQAYLYTVKERLLHMTEQESWEAFVRTCARRFLDTTFKEPW